MRRRDGSRQRGRPTSRPRRREHCSSEPPARTELGAPGSGRRRSSEHQGAHGSGRHLSSERHGEGGRRAGATAMGRCGRREDEATEGRPPQIRHALCGSGRHGRRTGLYHRCRHGRAREEDEAKGRPPLPWEGAGGGRGGRPAPPPWEGAGGGRTGRRTAPRVRVREGYLHFTAKKRGLWADVSGAGVACGDVPHHRRLVDGTGGDGQRPHHRRFVLPTSGDDEASPPVHFEPLVIARLL